MQVRNHNLMFAPGSREEESMMLMGRIEAVAAYIRGSQYIEREIIADMLGVVLEPVEEADHESVSL